MAPTPTPTVKHGAVEHGAEKPGGPTEPIDHNLALVVSFIVHAVGFISLVLMAFFKPHRASEVPVFELVSLEKPKLRPIQPKVEQPPEPPPPEPEPAPLPEAPKLTNAPSKPVVKKPEPKRVKERDPLDATPPKEFTPREQTQPNIVAHVPSDPRLSFWASRVKKKAETLWNPPTGIDILGTVKAVIGFKVSRDGTVQDAQVATGTGNSDLDALALATIQRMERVPPIPENYPDDVIQVSCEFVYAGQ